MRPIVFAGPTIDGDEVAQLLDADVRPPAVSGDLARAAALSPPAIVLIDGLYERVPAVTHKEILWALEQGVPVYGAASMGALRAAELDVFGMIGIGEVYERFRNGSLHADDDVAVAHLDAANGYRPVSVALVDVMATLERATVEHVIGPEQAKALVGVARRLHYPDRIWPSILTAAPPATTPATVVDDLRAWLPSGQRSMKADDARAALAAADADLASGAVEARDRDWSLARTVHWRRMEGELARYRSQTEQLTCDDLLAHLEGDGTADETLQRALLQCLATDHASRRGFAAVPDEAEAELRYRLGLDTDDGYRAWLVANDLDRADARRLATAQAALVWAAEQFDAETRNVVADVLRLRDRYPTVRAAIEARAVSR